MLAPSRTCLACLRGVPKRGRPRCPECGHVFRGAGWDGVDAHWRSHHAALMSYEAFWGSLCDAHRTAAPLDCACCRKGIPFTAARQCPECALVLKGKGWAGIEAHWKAHHSDVLAYEDFWASLCPAHRGDDDPTGLLPFDARPERRPRRGGA